MFSVHNTLSGKVEKFEPVRANEALMYHCGPTVYGEQHIGNLSMFVFTDILRRTLEIEGYRVRQVINFTDFGHLTSDADEGDDKMALGLKREGLEPTIENMHKLGEKYASTFLSDIEALNVRTEGTLLPYASEYVNEQIELIKTLEEKGFAYKTSDGIYYDIAKFPEYGKLGNINIADSGESRIESNSEKRNQRDFALWKFNSALGWPSPWGQGFPGWHIECSAMIIKLLGEQIDIHTGGVEHIGVHHNNEIAQSEAATGKSPFSKYWMHRSHLQIDGKKIAKSEGNVVYLSEIMDKGYSPLALRYLLLQSHYRTPTNFTWEALEAAQNAYRKIKEFVAEAPGDGGVNEVYDKDFLQALDNDLNTPEALAVAWKLIKDDSVSAQDKRATLLQFDKVLGLKLDQNEFAITEIPDEIVALLSARESARKNGDFATSDALREELRKKGFAVLDSASGQKITKI